MVALARGQRPPDARRAAERTTFDHVMRILAIDP